MKVSILITVLLLFFSVSAFAQYAFQITTERDVDGKCINWQDITADVTYTMNTDGTKQVFADHPDSDSLENDDLQEWYAYAPQSGFYLVSFSFTGVGLVFGPSEKLVQYWLRYSKDGVLFSEADDCIVMKPGKPIKR